MVISKIHKIIKNVYDLRFSSGGYEEYYLLGYIAM
jgi:hypothetical protein